MEQHKLDNPIHVPGLLSFLTYQRWGTQIKGLRDFPEDQWPDNVPLLYYSYHVMVGLGTIFIAVMGACSVLLWKKRLFEARWALWMLAMMLPFPYIANTAGWMTAELGRQPWLIYGLMRTAEGHSANVSAGNTLFSLIGFMGMYTILSILFLFLVYREIDHGPEQAGAAAHDRAPTHAA
jgi:cytochrome d ubiquinol oxidase subunit I